MFFAPRTRVGLFLFINKSCVQSYQLNNEKEVACSREKVAKLNPRETNRNGGESDSKIEIDQVIKEDGPPGPSEPKEEDHNDSVRKARPRPASPIGSLESGSSLELITGQSCGNGSKVKKMNCAKEETELDSPGAKTMGNGSGSEEKFKSNLLSSKKKIRDRQAKALKTERRRRFRGK